MDRDQWQEIGVVLGRNKLRTFLTAFGVFWGILMLVIMMGSGKGLQHGAAAGFGGSVTNSMYIWTQQTSMPYKGFRRGRNINFHNADVEAIRSSVPELDILSPRCQAGGYRGTDNITRGIKTGAFNIYGDYPQYLQVEPMDIIEGRFINYRDIEEKRKVCFIGREVYNTLYEPGEEAIGTYIRAQGINYKVIGVYKSKTDDPNRAEDQEKSIIIPLTTFQQAYNWGDVVGWLAVTAKPDVPVSRVGDKIKALVRQRQSIHPDDEMAFGSWNKEEQFNRMMGLLTGINILSLIVGTLTLLAGAIGVSNIMLVIVKERTKEFGVRRAIGAPPSSIIKQVVLESVVLTVGAGILGIIAGVWLLELVSAGMNAAAEQGGFFRNPGVELPIVLAAFFILVVSGVLAGIIPARKAVEVKPVEALRYE
ncbi:MAG: multidrug ABC transporter ATP-binding protein [Owenweeksia sp.]|nr:multidrug ABC transporter ATP-binding protein [Owenweeksia sp.]MBG00300.1 multidrug ABC transporter ATP-binding protein [Owenweeksia sp.]HBF20158.1 multidrug ABC transporter ATP-binding protein [Cryomorphaceae bacterium]HCQ15725.1 multidrug ABC transporter ATP-binding protein [Cryomorphaceae bacterium]